MNHPISTVALGLALLASIVGGHFKIGHPSVVKYTLLRPV